MIDFAIRLLEVLPAPLALAIGIAGLLAGGKCVVDGAVHLSRRMGVSPLLIGLTIVAFGTSTPELAFNIIAAINGNSELSFGNVVGSNIANIGLVLGISALAMPLVVHSRLVARELPLLLGVSAGMIVLGMLPPSTYMVTATTWGYTWPHGLVLLAAFVWVCVVWYRLSASQKDDPLSVEFTETGKQDRIWSVWLAIVVFVLGLGLLMGGGKLAEVGAVGTARIIGISDAMIALTVVAVATSLPEIVTSVIAARRGYSDLAIGNVIGSNFFNILLVLGMTAAIAPVAMPAERGMIDLIVMLGFTLVIWVLAARPGRMLGRGTGVFLLVLFFLYHSVMTVTFEVG